MSHVFYSSIGILALVIHLIISRGYYTNKDQRPEARSYKNYLKVVFVYFLADAAWGYLYHLGNLPLLYVDTIVYYITMAFSVVYCCRYVTTFLRLDSFLGKALNAVCILFAFTEIAVLVINHFHHIFFWFDANGVYQAYAFRHVALAAQCVMFGLLSVMSLYTALKGGQPKGGRSMTIALFGFSMTIALIAQGLYPLLPLYSIGIVLGTLFIHVFIHNEEVNVQLREIEALNNQLLEEQKVLQKQNEEIHTAFAIINGLSHDYHSIWWADKKDMKLHMIRASESVNKGAVRIAIEDLDADVIMHNYINNYVAEQDRERLRQQVNTKEVVEQLSKSDFYAVNFMRIKEGGGQDFNQMAFANADTSDGKHLFVFGFRDITDIVLQEQELHKEQMLRKELSAAKAAAEASNAAKTKFLHNMSHEIRTPLNAMFGFSQLLGLPDGSCTEEEKEQYNRYIYNSYRMLEMLISDILDIADSEHGNYRINITDVNVNSVCQNALVSVEYRVPATVKLHMTTDFPDDYTIHSDERRIQQVLINYLTNACKNTQEGEIHLHASHTEHPGKITFSVTDTGRGIPEEKADVIFTRFTKLHQEVQGSGLGLSICQTIASKLNGEVYLDTTYPDRSTGATGARFVFVVNDK